MQQKAKSYNIDKKLVYDAYKAVKDNAGAAGVDKQTIEQFDADDPAMGAEFRRIRHRGRRCLPMAGDKWHLDEVVITIGGTGPLIKTGMSLIF